ncbi:MAG TPA: Gfo/Idh/MocA family oxidoreductase [Microlunatus sp.]|nr:Gfo/Idh/MocA family oxidoreductase [Microlunatus sp.]
MRPTTAPRPAVRVAVVGLGFGADFVPLYRAHPDVTEVVLVDPDASRRAEIAARYDLAGGHSSLDDLLAAGDVDAVHLLTPVPTHASYTFRCLESGVHVACAVPMATTLDELEMIITGAERHGLVYQMMETAVFGREFRYVRSLWQRGELGTATLYTGSHVQNLDGFPSYWQGYPPMHYATHALSPALALWQTEVTRVTAHGAGILTPDRRAGGFDNPFPAEVGLFRLRDDPALVQVTMAFFQTGRSYVEGFSLYGDRGAVEWPADNRGPLTRHTMTGPDPGGRGNRVLTTTVVPPDDTSDLPESLRGFVAHGGHGGSHPYLVDSYIRAVQGRRPAAVDARTAASWTAPGICAHTSALAAGRAVQVPSYRVRGNRTGADHSPAAGKTTHQGRA